MKTKLRILIWLIFIFGGIALSIYMDQNVFQFEEVKNPWIRHSVSILGGIFFIFSFFNTGNVGRSLAKQGRKSKDLPRMQTDTLVTTGIYSMMRHPMNQTLMGFPMAIALMIVSPSFIFIVAPLEILAMYIMIRTIEEAETRKKFGKAYDEYCAITPRFCFKWKCIKALMQNPDAAWLNEKSEK